MSRESVANIPFHKLLGIQLSREHKDGVTLQMKVRKDLLNSHGTLHGGVAATIADAAVGASIHFHFKRMRAISTVEMKVNYFRPVAGGDTLYARAHLLRIGSTLCTGRVDLTDKGRNLVGIATVTYIYLDMKK